MAASLITVNDCRPLAILRRWFLCVYDTKGSRTTSHWPSPLLFCMRTARDWDLIGQRKKRCFMIWRVRIDGKPDGWCCADGALYSSTFCTKYGKSSTCWLCIVYHVYFVRLSHWHCTNKWKKKKEKSWISYLYVSGSLRGVMCVLSGSWFELVCPALSSALAFVPPVMNCGSLGFSWSVS